MPTKVFVGGKLGTFPNFTYMEAAENNLTSDTPRKAGQVRPTYHVLVTQKTYDKVKAAIKTEIDASVAKSKLTKAQGTKLHKLIDSDTLDSRDGFFALKDLNQWEQDNLTGYVAKLRVTGPSPKNSGKPDFNLVGSPESQPGIERMVKVTSDDDMKSGAQPPATYPAYVAEGETVHEVYPGAIVSVTVSISAGSNSGTLFVNAYGDDVVWNQDGNRIGGGGRAVSSVDDEEDFDVPEEKFDEDVDDSE